MRPEIGEQLGDYLLEEVLRAGGAQTTYLAKKHNREVVVKAFSLGESEGWKPVELFERSIRALSNLDIEGVPSFLDSFEEESRGLRVLVREYVPGETLAEKLDSGWHPPEESVRALARSVLGILEELHGRNPPIIHRDIKPANIVVCEDEDVYLIDFGVVRATPHREETHPGTVVGTYGYMAPEQFRGHAVPATDLYGLGATLVRIVTGREPSELPYEQVRVRFREYSNVAPDFADWLDKMMAPGLENRFESARAAARALDSDAVRDTVEGNDANPVAIADTVPDRTAEGSGLEEVNRGASPLSPDVTAARILASAPEGYRIEVRVRRHCLEFELPRHGFFNRGGNPPIIFCGIGVFVLVGIAVAVVQSGSFGPIVGLPLVLWFLGNALYAGAAGQIVQVGKGFLQAKYQLFGRTYSSYVRTEVDSVELSEAKVGTVYGKTIRIWSGVGDRLDIGRQLSPPELDWFQSLLTFCIEHPESVRRSERFRKQLDAEAVET